jgi:O-acetyl-ADP-ribose deacetylase (regulator of RNase III)
MNATLVESILSTGQSLQIVHGDITIEDVDAIVNAANEQLQHGSGVAWAIVKRGGDVIHDESRKWIKQHGPVSHSHPAWTSGGALPAKYVIHAVGPVWGDGDEDKKLSDAVMGSLQVADELKCSSISMPAISTGIFGFPKDRAAQIILGSIDQHFVKTHESGIRQIRIVLFDVSSVQVFVKAWQKYKSKNNKTTLDDWIDGISEFFS